MAQFVIENYFSIVVSLTVLGLLFHLLWLILGFDEDWSVFTFLGKAGAFANIAVIFPLLKSVDDPDVFKNLPGNDAIVVLASVCIGYFAVSNIVPKYLAERVRTSASKRYKANMKTIDGGET